MNGFEVLNAGIFSSIQDLGRVGYSHLGISDSGAMDEYAYLWSQKLLRNQNCNALEVMVGLKLQAKSTTTIAICGADLDFKINGVAKPIWQTYTIKAGDILSFERRVSGHRSYLAVKESFEVAQKYGSYASTLKEEIGFKLKKGDFLAFRPFQTKHTYRVQSKYIPTYKERVTLRVLLSYQESSFAQKEKEIFFSSSYEITLQSDRMGYKLKGRAITSAKGGIISEGIAFGSIQIPKDGQPIILLKERQTIGGYPKIGTLLPIDCFKLAQLPFGAMVRFKEIKIEQAQAKMRDFYRYFRLN